MLSKFIVVVSAATAVDTTVQKFIVVVMPGTHVHTTVQKFIVVVSAATAVSYDSTEIYRENGDDEDEDEDDEGAKSGLNSLNI